MLLYLFQIEEDSLHIFDVTVDEVPELFEFIDENNSEVVRLAVHSGTFVNVERKDITLLHLAAMSDETANFLTELLDAVKIEINAE